MNRHRHALQLIAEARPAMLDDAPDRPVPAFPDEIGSTQRAPRRRLLVAGLVPTAAVAIAAVVLVMSGSNPPAAPSHSLSPQTTTARGLLLAAADKTAAAPATGDHWVTRLQAHHLYDVGDYNVLGRIELETWYSVRPGGDTIRMSRWLGAAPATDADKAAWKAAGAPTKWTMPGPEGERRREISAAPGPRDVSDGWDGGFDIGGTPLTYAQVRALPTDPAKLKAHLIALDDAAGHDGVWTPDQLARWHVEMLFSRSSLLLTQLPVSSAVRVATYRMLADLPGLTTVGTVPDAKGRVGAGIEYTYRVDDRSVKTRLIIDPKSGAVLAIENAVEATLFLDGRFTNARPPRP